MKVWRDEGKGKRRKSRVECFRGRGGKPKVYIDGCCKAIGTLKLVHET
jgi:hypothetical protein